MGKRVTIQDIADELGLSRNTVSKALNNSEGLADATRTRILQKAMEMGYKQFAYAQSILNRAEVISSDPLIDPNDSRREFALFSTLFLQGPHFASLMLDFLQNELSQLGYTLNTHRVTEQNIADHTLPITFVPEHVAAIICIEVFDQSYAEMVCNLGIPVLFVDGPARIHGEDLPCDQLYMDNTTMVTRVVNDMLAGGRRRIGFIGDWEHCRSFHERYTAFRLAMLLGNAPVKEEHCIKENHLVEIVNRLEALDEMPDLFICANDFVAFDVMQALRSLGKTIPDDVGLVGFDDSAESRRCIPPLTTIHIHTQVMAYTAMQLLRTRIKEPSLDYRKVYTQTDLIYRESAEKPA